MSEQEERKGRKGRDSRSSAVEVGGTPRQQKKTRGESSSSSDSTPGSEDSSSSNEVGGHGGGAAGGDGGSRSSRQPRTDAEGEGGATGHSQGEPSGTSGGGGGGLRPDRPPTRESQYADARLLESMDRMDLKENETLVTPNYYAISSLDGSRFKSDLQFQPYNVLFNPHVSRMDRASVVDLFNNQNSSQVPIGFDHNAMVLAVANKVDGTDLMHESTTCTVNYKGRPVEVTMNKTTSTPLVADQTMQFVQALNTRMKRVSIGRVVKTLNTTSVKVCVILMLSVLLVQNLQTATARIDVSAGEQKLDDGETVISMVPRAVESIEQPGEAYVAENTAVLFRKIRPTIVPGLVEVWSKKTLFHAVVQCEEFINNTNILPHFWTCNDNTDEVCFWPAVLIRCELPAENSSATGILPDELLRISISRRHPLEEIIKADLNCGNGFTNTSYAATENFQQIRFTFGCDVLSEKVVAVGCSGDAKFSFEKNMCRANYDAMNGYYKTEIKKVVDFAKYVVNRSANVDEEKRLGRGVNVENLRS